jgi:hypothetical protein
LQRAVWTNEALALIRRFFPAEPLPDYSWSDTYREFLRLVEKSKLFVVDWPTLDNLWDWWMSVGDDDDEDAGISQPERLMAEFLYGPPVKFYNFSLEQWANDVSDSYPLLDIVAQLVREDIDLDIDTLLAYEIYDNNLDELDIDANAGSAADLPEPLCWLPLLVDFVRGSTDNPLLDGCIDLVDWDGDLLFSWDDFDLTRLKYLSADAAATWAKIEKLCEFAGDDMLPVMEVLLYGNTESVTLAAAG